MKTQTDICQESGCTKVASSRGLCRNHYATWYYRQKKVVQSGVKKELSMQIPRTVCRISGCEQQEMNNYLCKDHYELLLGNSLDFEDR
ncbi:hypothetical protein [Paenibacillus eucommiae]|uniref:Uncharacterized protein n=1 Tax=Paenibacillus eucommiae TaxID=1355755 RepID=A0ABS4IUB2_9BACL|nr:hypothetical protein [Paenibacillus eucommiae]MBP1991157.1 hypothetical protein [Paenibacillus eucommiae]